MNPNVHRLETGYQPKSSSEIDEDFEKLQQQAAQIVAEYDGVLHCIIEMYRMARVVSGDPIR